MTGPVLVIPYRATATETVVESGQSVTRSRDVMRELTLAPETSSYRPTFARSCASARSTKPWSTTRRSAAGRASPFRPTSREPAFSPRRWTSAAPNCASASATRAALAPIRGSLRTAGPLRLQPGGGSGGGRGFFAWIDAKHASTLSPLGVDFAYDLRGNAALSLAPQAGDTRWRVRSSWPHPELRRRVPARHPKRHRQGLRRHLPDRQPRARPFAGFDRRCWVIEHDRARAAAVADADGGDGRQRWRAGPDRADQPDPAGRPLFAGQPRRRNTASCSSASPSSPC